MIRRIRCALMRAHIRQLRTVAGLIVPLTAAELLWQAWLQARAAEITADLYRLENVR